METDVGRNREHCDACGFDSDLYNRADTVSSQPIVPAVIEAAYEGLADELLAVRPDATTWSIGEYVDHVREVAFGNRFAIDLAVSQPGTDVGNAPESTFANEVRNVDVPVALAACTAEFDALGQRLAGLSDHDWSAPVIVDGEPTPVGWFARHVIHDGLHHMADIGRIVHGLGHGAPSHQGHVEFLHVSSGGVPKRPVGFVDVDGSGCAGDAQNDRRHHGRPVQAVCLWSADVIAELQAEGHPIAAGNAGENITVAGVQWGSLRPGTRIQVGSVPMLVSAHAIPCAKNAQWFSDRDFKRILHDQHPGFSRLYAIPFGAGRIQVGDPVEIEPSADA